MQYKRIARTKYAYALYPKNKPTEEIIAENGGDNHDFFESVYNYDQHHYDKFISGLKEVCSEINVPFRKDKLIDTCKNVFRELGETKLNKPELKAKFSVAGSVDVKTNRLVFDFDNEKDIESAKNDTQECVSRLCTTYGVNRDSILTCFSGSKGFSVELVLEEDMSRREFENVTKQVADGLSTHDKSVTDEQRVFRVPLTRHQTSGLYKIPIHLDDLSDNVDQFKSWAGTEFEENKEGFQKGVNEFLSSPSEMTGAVKKLKTLAVEEKKALDNAISPDTGIDFSEKPTWLTRARYAIQQGFFEEGERSNALTLLAATYRNQGFQKEVAYRMLKGVAELQAKRNNCEPFPKKEIWNYVIGQVYSPSWKRGQYTEDAEIIKSVKSRLRDMGIECDTDNGGSLLMGIKDVVKRFFDYAKSFSKNRIKIGIKELDDNLVATTGMAIGILAAPGAGKTTLVKNFLKSNDEPILFECLDMTDPFMLARFAQEHSRMSFEEMCSRIEEGDTETLNEVMAIVEEQYKNVTFQFNSGTSIDDIREHIQLFKQVKGFFPRVVVVDYLEKVRGPYSDDTANSGFVASRLSDLAREFNCCVIVLLQPQKLVDAADPILSMRRIKGSSKIEQDLRAVLALWRPFMKVDCELDDNFVSIAVVKNNLGGLGKYDLFWDGQSGIIRSMTQPERDLYEKQMHQLKEQQEAEQKNNDWRNI